MLGSKNSGFGEAIFDVKPVDEFGHLDLQKIDNIQPTIDLTSFKPKKSRQQSVDRPIQALSSKQDEGVKEAEQSLPPVIGLPTQQNIKEQFEELMRYDLDLGIELAKIDSTTASKYYEDKSRQAKPRYRTIQNRSRDIDQYAPLILDIHNSSKAIAREEYNDSSVEIESEHVFTVPELSQSAETDVRALFFVPPPDLVIRKGLYAESISIPKKPKFKIRRTYVYIAVAVVVALVAIIQYGLHLKRQIVLQGSAAVTSLQMAQDDLKSLDFKNASQDFFSAFSNFSQAGDTLNVFGAGITDIIASFPGGNSLKSAKNLVQVGQLLSAAGTSMATALDAISKTGAFDSDNFEFDGSGQIVDNSVGIGAIVSALKKALLSSQQQVSKANALMVDIDDSIIPEDKKDNFTDLKLKLPEFETGVNMSVEYVKFFENLINNGKAKYIVMFQNGSELRPTGGFPGTYGIVSFNNGKMESLFVDDVYNIDGQLKENIIPPLQMQHITPNWGMRDANWYVDFPTSARNVAAFYKKESGQSVDGVIVVNPEMIAKILDIVGPVEMPQYNLTLTSQNVLTTIQDQVEYGPNRIQPKQIVKDFAPLLLTKIYGAGSDKWLTIFNTLVLSMNKKDMLMYFNNLSLESFVIDKGFGGQVHQGDGDYLMATITNIKGSKTDAVTDTSMFVDTRFENDSAIHKVTITRQHNGGKEKFGFYNKQNPAYVRILVPDGSELISITGNDKPNFKPLINYSGTDFVRDENLVKFETSGTTNNTTGVITYHESGKTEFGFWLITDAGKSKSVTIQYRVPKALQAKSYELYIQKQPALKIKNFSLTMEKPAGLTPDASYPLFNQQGSTYNYTAPLENDLMVKIDFK